MQEIATFGAGCFWGIEAAFRQIPGVIATTVGYTGGRTDHPSYEQVCSHTTGHAEAVEINYDPAKLSYDKLLEVFWENHDPTQLNRQGPDRGPQYRSAIFYSSAEQKRIAEAYIKQLDDAKVFRAPIVTQVVPLTAFYHAEEHHQNFCNRNPRNPYVLGVAMPKVEKVKEKVPELVKEK